MRRIVLYALILIGMMWIPVEPSDVGKLLPVQVVAIYKEGNRIVIETDTEDIGVGETPEESLENLMATAGGILYLDTAGYLLLTEETQAAVEALRKELKPTVGLCLVKNKPDLRETSKYLSVHGDLPKLKNWKTGTELPVLSTFGDSLIFLKKVENKA